MAASLNRVLTRDSILICLNDHWVGVKSSDHGGAFIRSDGYATSGEWNNSLYGVGHRCLIRMVYP